jgi:hypothetical protein
MPGIVQAGQVSHAPAWDGIPFTSQTQWDGAGTSAQVVMSDIMSCVHSTTRFPLQEKLLHRSYADFDRDWSWLDDFYINPNTEAPVNLPVETTTTGVAGGVGTVLGKRARERYGISSKVQHKLIIMTAAALDRPEREGGQAQVGSWSRQRGPQRGFTIR